MCGSSGGGSSTTSEPEPTLTINQTNQTSKDSGRSWEEDTNTYFQYGDDFYSLPQGLTIDPDDQSQWVVDPYPQWHRYYDYSAAAEAEAEEIEAHKEYHRQLAEEEKTKAEAEAAAAAEEEAEKKKAKDEENQRIARQARRSGTRRNVLEYGLNENDARTVKRVLGA